MRGIAISLVLVGLVVPACVDGAGAPELSTQALESRSLAYVPVDITTSPPSLDGWAPVGLADDGDVYGQGFDCNDDFSACSLPLVKRARDGQFTVLHPDFQVFDVDDKGNVGGCTIDDPATFTGRAAVVTPAGALRLVPALPGEVSACVTRVADDRVAVVDSFDADFARTSYVLDKGRVVPLPLDVLVEDINGHGQVTGLTFTPDGARAYRFDAATAALTILEPVAGDPESWGQGINRHGDVLGYSFVAGGLERIGHWDPAGQFSTSFVEGTPEHPTVSNRLAWNEAGLIVISFSFRDPNTYLVPSPGTRLNLADLVAGAEVPGTLYALTLNAGGDLLANSFDDGRTFLFLRQ